MKPHLIKQYDGSFLPRDKESAEWAAKKKIGSAHEVKESATRNYKYHCKYFGMLNLAWENQEQFKTMDLLRKAVQVNAGYYDTEYRLDGTCVLVARSIAFGSMSPEEFEKLYSDVLNVILKHFGFGEEFEMELILQFG